MQGLEGVRRDSAGRPGWRKKEPREVRWKDEEKPKMHVLGTGVETLEMQ